MSLEGPWELRRERGQEFEAEVRLSLDACDLRLICQRVRNTLGLARQVRGQKMSFLCLGNLLVALLKEGHFC